MQIQLVILVFKQAGLLLQLCVLLAEQQNLPKRRGLAMGLNEAAGYGAVALAAALSGFIATRAGLRPEPFLLGVAFMGLGLGASVLFVRESLPLARMDTVGAGDRSVRDVFALATWRDRSLSACSQAGLVNNLNDGMAWGLLPLWFARNDLSVASVGLLAALYPGVWGIGQLFTGAMSDRVGRKPLIVGGMLVQAAAIGLIASTGSFAGWAFASTLLGVGTAMVYPTLLAAVGDVAHPRWRPRDQAGRRSPSGRPTDRTGRRIPGCRLEARMTG